jgi:hypothetical protein
MNYIESARKLHGGASDAKADYSSDFERNPPIIWETLSQLLEAQGFETFCLSLFS